MQVTRDDVVTARLSHVASLFFGVPLAMTTERANQIRGFLVQRMRGERPSAIELVGDRSESGPLTQSIDRDGIALVSLRGTLTPKALPGVDALSGLVSHEQLAASLRDLGSNPAVRGVVVAMESPGGAVMGLTESAAAMRALSASKPVFVVADHLMASAAYWIGSQASKVFVSETSVVGSIGSLIVRHDATAADEKAGDRFEFVRDMGRKGDGDEHKAITPEEIAAKLEIVRQADAMFFAAVAERRPLTVEQIAALDGAVFMGRDAMARGLADAVGTVPDALAAMRKKLKINDGTARAAARGNTMDDETKETPAPAAVAPEVKVIPITDDPRIKAAIDEATARATQDAHEVVALCAAFRCPERANAFLAAKQTREQVFAVLQADLVARDQATTTNGAHAADAAMDAAPKKLDPEKYDAHWEKALGAAHAARHAPIVVS